MSHFRPWPWPRVLAHRGGGTLAPENTLGAIRVGIAHGYRGVEIDAMLPADDTPILMHDPVLGRTVAGKGKVSDRPAHELLALDAGRWHSERFAGETVPTLHAALELCSHHGVWVNVEIKPAPGHEQRTGAAVADQAAVVRAGSRTPLLSSFSSTALDAARQAQPALPRGLLVQRVPRDWRAQLETLACVALHVDHKHLDAEQARAVKAAGYWLFCYTVNTPERAAELSSWGVDAFCTDRIDRIAADAPAYRDARGSAPAADQT